MVLARFEAAHPTGTMRSEDSERLAKAAERARLARVPLVMVVSTIGAAVEEGFAAQVAWARAARELAACSGTVPVIACMAGPVLAGPSMLVGLADLVVVTQGSFAYLSGPNVVASFTGRSVTPAELGGPEVHLSSSGLAAVDAESVADALELISQLLSYLPSDTDSLPPMAELDDPPDRATNDLRRILELSASSSYDVRDVIREVVDHGELLELYEHWAPQVVVGLARLAGRPVGVVANQPQRLAGTLDIQASQKAARFVSFCDAFNLGIVTMVDTPGFLPGKDLEWRGMIRHGAELAFSYAQATVPRVSLVLRKAYGGAYIVMDSKGIGGDICLAWPSAEIAVMGAAGAVQILFRRASEEERRQAEEDYRREFLTPWVAAERGLVDAVIDPAETRYALYRSMELLWSKREELPWRAHSNSPL